jgi:hypothetical protein
MAEVWVSHKIHVRARFAANILGFWLSPCNPLINELAKSAILVVCFLTRGILDVIPVASLMIRSSFLMPTIMTASITPMSTATAWKISTTMVDRPAWTETRNMVTTPMLRSPIRSKVRSTTMEEKPGANTHFKTWIPLLLLKGALCKLRIAGIGRFCIFQSRIDSDSRIQIIGS